VRLLSIVPMTDRTGEDRPRTLRKASSDLLSPIPDDNVSEVGSFTRTRPDIEDDEELEMPAAQEAESEGPTASAAESPEVAALDSIEDDASVKTPDGAFRDNDLSVQVRLLELSLERITSLTITGICTVFPRKCTTIPELDNQKS
jgi:hypothetical protein